MTAVRQIFLGRGGAKLPTARDYVQDGLIAMWDGIENAGWGQHEDSPIVWKDLTNSGYDFTHLDSINRWTADSAVFTGTSGKSYPQKAESWPLNCMEIRFPKKQ